MSFKRFWGCLLAAATLLGALDWSNYQSKKIVVQTLDGVVAGQALAFIFVSLACGWVAVFLREDDK